MILDEKKYVPILKWKRAEQNALRDLADDRKDKIVPVIELVMPKPVGKVTADSYHDTTLEALTDEKIVDYVTTINKVWHSRPFFLDFTWIYKEVRINVAQKTIGTAVSEGLEVIPVVNMFDDAKLKDVILEERNKYDLDIALRISRLDLEDLNELNKRLASYLSLPHSKKDNTHLIIDLKEMTDEKAYAKYASTSQNIIHLKEWKSLVLASGAFPIDLSECDRTKNPTSLPRNDWAQWKRFSDTQPERIPVFSDYGIRYPIYFESHLILHPTTSIKYTTADSWVIYKGEVRKFEKYLANADTLTKSGDYYGEYYSTGDRYIKERANHFTVWARIKTAEDEEKKKGTIIKKSKAKGTGSTETWLSAGFNHHMSVVADQVSS